MNKRNQNFSDLSFKDKYKNVFEKLKNNIELFCEYIDDISNPKLYEENNIDFIKTESLLTSNQMDLFESRELAKATLVATFLLRKILRN